MLRLELDVAPDPLALARKLSEREGLAVLWSADGRGPAYLACEPLSTSSALDPEPGLTLSHAADPLAARVPRWIGLLPYEAMRGCERPQWLRRPETRSAPHHESPLWFRYGAVAEVSDRVTVCGDHEPSLKSLVQQLTGGDIAPGRSTVERCPWEPAALHRERICTALELIAQGEVYEVNLARRLDFRVRGGLVDLLAQLGQSTRAEYCSALVAGGARVLCTSPELFLGLEPGGRVWTVPIKGTRARSTDAAEDRRRALELDADPKEHAELAMVIDIERNDLGRVAEVGSVCVPEPPRVVGGGTVWHRRAEVSAVLRPEVSRTELLLAMLPSGSVTGAPKVRAMEVIADLEAARRGLYTGAIGYLSHDGGLSLAMAIRTLTEREGLAHYGVGGGIVADSDPDREVEETLWKAEQLLRLAVAT